MQRVTQALVLSNGEMVGKIDSGLVVFLGIGKPDTENDARYLVNKIANLRIFSDNENKFNYSITDTQSKILLVSQFTLYANTSKGNRPSFTEAATPREAKILIERFAQMLNELGIKVEQGQFQEHMSVYLINDGPVTIMLDSNNDANNNSAQSKPIS